MVEGVDVLPPVFGVSVNGGSIMFVVTCGLPDAPVERFSREDDAMQFACLMIDRDARTGIADGADWQVEEEPDLVPNYKVRQSVECGLVYDVLMPFSECAMHMRIAGKMARVRACPSGVRLIGPDGSDGVHMTDGEAGVYSQGRERYVYGVRRR